MTLSASCATIAALLASAQGGETIVLKGHCTAVAITRQYRRQLTIDASASRVAGLVITGANVRWRGGTITASGGAHGFAGGGYGILLHGGAANIAVEGVTVTAAKKGIVVDQARNIAVSDSRFIQLGEDGIIASRVTGLTVVRNHFTQTIGKPTDCKVNGVVRFGLPQRDCAGVWKDGYHADAVQMRNGVVGARLTHNRVDGATAGLTHMDTTGDAPLRNVFVGWNFIRTDGYHRITLGPNCVNCAIENNRVERSGGSTKRAIIIAGAARRCGNYAQDERVQDGRC